MLSSGGVDFIAWSGDERGVLTRAVASAFPSFRLSGMELKFVDVFKYVGHIICNNECDDKDVLREVRTWFTRTNILARRFSLCIVLYIC